jgi:hypothetical protein
MTPEERADRDQRIDEFERWQARREQDEAREFNARYVERLQKGTSLQRWGWNSKSLPEGFHDRWELLTVEDIKFLIAVGIDPIS